MISTPPVHDFYPGPPDGPGIISWIHIGDLHMVRAQEQNHRDLVAIIDQVNRVFASSIAFAFLPGDVAEHGRAVEYSIVRETLEDQLCAVLGASAYHSPQRALRDQDNALPPWPERGLMGTQLGPNMNGRKW
jgi:hypothetical protein